MNRLNKDSTLLEKCVALTSFIETGKMPLESYSGMSGNFDGQGFSFGCLQFCLGQGSLQPLLKEMIQSHSAIVDNIFGNGSATFKEMLNKTDIQSQVAWSAAIQTNNKILPEWKDRFYKLGQTNEMQQIQLKVAKNVFDKALAMMPIYQVKSQRAAAMFFDLRTQQGGISDTMKLDILQTFVKQNITDEVQKLTIIAIKRAETANPKWISDVKARRLAIVNGSGICHASNLNLEKDFFITLENAV